MIRTPRAQRVRCGESSEGGHGNRLGIGTRLRGNFAGAAQHDLQAVRYNSKPLTARRVRGDRSLPAGGKTELFEDAVPSDLSRASEQRGGQEVLSRLCFVAPRRTVGCR